MDESPAGRGSGSGLRGAGRCAGLGARGAAPAWEPQHSPTVILSCEMKQRGHGCSPCHGMERGRCPWPRDSRGSAPAERGARPGAQCEARSPCAVSCRSLGTLGSRSGKGGMTIGIEKKRNFSASPFLALFGASCSWAPLVNSRDCATSPCNASPPRCYLIFCLLAAFQRRRSKIYPWGACRWEVIPLR